MFLIYTSQFLKQRCLLSAHVISELLYSKPRTDWKMCRPSIPLSILDFILDTNHAGLVASIMVSHGTLLSKSCFDIMASSVIMGSKSSSPIISISTYDIGNVTEEIIPNISQ